MIISNLARHKITTLLAFLTGLLAGVYYITLAAVDLTMVHVPGDLGDARFNNYLLEHSWLYFTGHLDSFWNAPFMYPEENVITYSDNLLGAFPFYAIFRGLGYSRETSFQYWYVLVSVLNYTCCYFFLRYLFRNTYAAVCGAMIFAFSIALQSQIGHAQTFPRFMVPLALWMCVIFVKELRVKYFFLAMLCIAYQMYCGFYLGFMLCVPVGIFLLSSVFFQKGLYNIRLKSSRWIWTMVASIFATIIILLPIVIPYLKRASQTGFYEYEQVVQSVPTLISFFYSHHGSYFWDFINNIGVSYPAFWDHQIFPGGVAIICVMIAFLIAIIKLSGKRTVTLLYHPFVFKILLITALCTFILFVRVNEFSLYRLVFNLPGFGAMRALQRIINIELVFMALAVTFVTNLFLKEKHKLVFLWFVAVVTIIVLDNRIHPDTVHKHLKSESTGRVDALLAKIGSAEKNQILSFEPDSITDKQIYFQLDAMLAAQTLNIRTLNGYSATSPKGYNGYWQTPNKTTREIWLREKKLVTDKILVIR